MMKNDKITEVFTMCYQRVQNYCSLFVTKLWIQSEIAADKCYEFYRSKEKTNLGQRSKIFKKHKIS